MNTGILRLSKSHRAKASRLHDMALSRQCWNVIIVAGSRDALLAPLYAFPKQTTPIYQRFVTQDYAIGVMCNGHQLANIDKSGALFRIESTTRVFDPTPFSKATI